MRIDKRRADEGTGGSAPNEEVTVATPLGPMTLRGTVRGLTSAWFDESAAPSPAPMEGSLGTVAAAARALAAYFAGDAGEESPPLDLRGTDFQRAVWDALQEIPFGETRSYREIAEAVDRPRAVRAVAAAIGANPVGVLVPCHRVIGSDGTLTGYAGGIDRKRWLLGHEGAALSL